MAVPITRQLILVRHPPVAKAWSGRCYGQSDMGLSREGKAMLSPLVEQLAAMKPDHVIHSGLLRTRVLAEPLARRLGVPIMISPAWRERHFGSWEGRTWQSIYRQTGNAMDGMIDAPDAFRPGGNGETTCELIARIVRALAALPPTERVAIITHGGPIAAAHHVLEGSALAEIAFGVIPPASFTVADA